jgi:hypothetical protein
MIGEGTAHEQQTCLVHGNLPIVILLKTRLRRVFHDRRIRSSEVVLVPLTRPWHRRGRRAATWTPPCRLLPLRPLGHLLLIFGRFGCRALCSARFQYGFGHGLPREAILSPRNLLAQHQPIGPL